MRFHVAIDFSTSNVLSIALPSHTISRRQTRQKRDALSSEPEKFETMMMDETDIDDADRRSFRTNFQLTMMMKGQDLKQIR